MTGAFGETGKGAIRLVSEGIVNPPPTEEASAYYQAFQAKYPDGNIDQTRISNTVGMLAEAIKAAGTADDVVAVATALEGMEYQTIWGSKVMMRAEDHQAIQNINILNHTDEGVTFPFDGSTFGVVSEQTVEMASADAPTTCEMQRP
jgi:branched-chain amino acid transport system substrate-binding protein